MLCCLLNFLPCSCLRWSLVQRKASAGVRFLRSSLRYAFRFGWLWRFIGSDKIGKICLWGVFALSDVTLLALRNTTFPILGKEWEGGYLVGSRSSRTSTSNKWAILRSTGILGCVCGKSLISKDNGMFGVSITCLTSHIKIIMCI